MVYDAELDACVCAISGSDGQCAVGSADLCGSGSAESCP